MRQRLRGLAGTVLLMALTVGLPWALAVTIGNPARQWDAIRAGDISDQAVIAILAAVAWLAWVSFAVALIVEFGALVAGHVGLPLRRVRIPLLGVQQDLARTLLAAVVLLLGPVMATVAAPAQSFATPVSTVDAPASPVARMAATASTQHAASEQSTISYAIPTSGGMTTYWDLAVHYLGDGQRWPEIWQLNAGRPQPDGAVMTSPHLLRRGWTVLIPSTARTNDAFVTVHRGDTLSDLAADAGISDWRTIWPANDRHAEPHGARFTDPDHIEPGWTIVLPESDAGHHSITPQHSSPPVASPARPSPNRHPRPDPTDSSRPSMSPTPHAPAPTRALVHPAGSAHHSSSTLAPIALFAGGGLLLAGTTLAALRSHRRRADRFRRPGRMIGATPADLAPIEKALVSAGTPAAVDVTFLDEALRSMVHAQASEPGRHLPDVVAARLTEHDLELALAAAQPDPPPPWTCDAEGVRWHVDRSAAINIDPSRRASHWAPYPTLATVGYTANGETWLLDLERIEAMSLVGPAEQCLNLARFLAAELAHNSWSEQLRVTMVGFGAEMAELNPSRLSHADDLEAAIAALHRQFDQISRAADDYGVNVLDGRLRDIAADAWAPHVLLVAPHVAADRTSVDQLLAAMRYRGTRSAIALVLAEDPGHISATRWQIHLEMDGALRIPALDLTLTAQQLPADEAGDLAALIALAASGEDEPIPPAHGDQPWDQFADATGAPRPEITRGRLCESTTATDIGVVTAADGDTKPSVIVVPPDAVEEIEQSDPSLESDLAAWLDPDCPVAKLRLLGRPRLTGAAGALPPHKPREDFYTEVITYLATRTGTTSAQLGTAIWPNDPGIIGKTTPRQAVTIARNWLDANPVTGVEYVPYAGDGSATGLYRAQGLLIDAELFRRLRLRGTARGEQGISDLVAALGLVDGPPLDHAHIPARRNAATGVLTQPYSWLVDCPLDREYLVMIADTADAVAQHFLGVGAPQQAAWAAQTAVRAGDQSDTPLLNLMRVADAQENRAEGDEYLRRIMCNHDAEVEEDLPPRTYEAVRRRAFPQAS